jgi:peptidoglycan/LPS O-acetylase OafA/YrhL
MPIYYFAYLIPLLGGYLLHYKGNTNNVGIFLSLFASQSITRKHYLDWPNPPLWSLSVEIYLSLILILLFKLSKNKITVVICVSLFVYLFVTGDFPILCGLPIFFLGVFLAKSELMLEKKLNRSLGLALLAIYLIFSSYFFREIGKGFFGIILPFCFVAALMIFLTNVDQNLGSFPIAKYLGSRSYVIYAIHTPIFFLINHLTHRFKTIHSLSWLITEVLITFLFVEIAYKYIEIPAIHFSRKFK